jgi:hypothetical protein
VPESIKHARVAVRGGLFEFDDIAHRVLATRTLKGAEVVVSRIRLDVTKPHLNAAVRALGKSNSAIAKLHQKRKHLVGQLLWQVICRSKRLADLSPNGAVIESCVPGNIRARPEFIGCRFPALLRRIVQHGPPLTPWEGNHASDDFVPGTCEKRTARWRIGNHRLTSVAMVGRGVLPIRGGLDPPNAARPTDAHSRLKASF